MSISTHGRGTVSTRFRAIAAAFAVMGLTVASVFPAAAQDAGAAPVPVVPEATPAASPAPPSAAAEAVAGAVQADAGVDPDAIVATVNGEPITERDLEITAQFMGDQLSQFPQENWRQIEIEVAIEFKLMSAAARGEGLDQDTEFQAEIAMLAERVLRDNYIQAIILPTITEDDITAAYNTAVAGMDLPQEVEIGHIMVATEAEANDAIRRLNNGEDFAALAFDLSLDRQTAENGGLIAQYWQPGELIQELDDVVFTIEAGQVLQYPIQIGDNWHVIKVIDSRTQPAPTYDDMRATLQQQLVTQAYADLVAGLRDAADVQITDAAAASAAPPASDAAAPASPAPASGAAATPPSGAAATPAPAGP